MKDVQIAIIEDDKMIRESLQVFIKSKTQYSICQTSGSVEDFLDSNLNDQVPTIMILDIGLPGLSGIDGIPLIKKKYPNLDIIMLTTYQEVEIIFKALCNGACSYISKRTPLPKIIEALHIVANGGSYMSPSIARKIAENMAGTAAKIKKIELTSKQKEIVNYIIEGLTYGEVAEKCGISVNTVRFHIKKTYAALQISSKVELYKKFVDGEI